MIYDILIYIIIDLGMSRIFPLILAQYAQSIGLRIIFIHICTYSYLRKYLIVHRLL